MPSYIDVPSRGEEREPTKDPTGGLEKQKKKKPRTSDSHHIGLSVNEDGTNVTANYRGLRARARAQFSRGTLRPARSSQDPREY